MKAAPLLLIPTIAAWFAGSLWWLGQRDVCGCAAVRGQASAPLTLGTTTVQAPAITSAPTPVQASTSIASTPAVAAPVSPDPILLRPMVVPFVKNTQEPGTSAALETYLHALAAHLALHPEARVSITGHTDADGDPGLNRRLSAERAGQMKAVLVASGIPADRISTNGAGADRPISDNLTSKGKALNRRVEILLDAPSDPQPPTTTP